MEKDKIRLNQVVPFKLSKMKKILILSIFRLNCLCSLCAFIYSTAPYWDLVFFLLLFSRLQIQLGVNMPARAEPIPGKEETQMFHEVYDVVLYLGVIDILQEYNIHKKIEHAYKSIQFDSLSISAVDPKFYSERFLEFVQKVFPPNVVASWKKKNSNSGPTLMTCKHQL